MTSPYALTLMSSQLTKAWTCLKVLQKKVGRVTVYCSASHYLNKVFLHALLILHNSLMYVRRDSFFQKKIRAEVNGITQNDKQNKW